MNYRYNYNYNYRNNAGNNYRNKKKNIVPYVIAIIIAIFIVVGIVFTPVIKAVVILSKTDNFKRFNYTADIHLKQNTSEEQSSSLITGLIGIEQSDFSTLKISGRFYDETFYGKLYCEGMNEPLTDVYIKKDYGIINARMLYDTIKSNITENYSLLAVVLPDWNYNDYITFEQIKQITGYDIQETFNTDNFGNENTELNDYMDLLKMKFEENSDGSISFKKDIEKYDLTISVSENLKIPQLAFEGKSINTEETLESFNAEILFDKTESIELPASIMSDEDIDNFASLWELLSGLIV